MVSWVALGWVWKKSERGVRNDGAKEAFGFCLYTYPKLSIRESQRFIEQTRPPEPTREVELELETELSYTSI